MLNRYAKALFKSDRICNMEPVGYMESVRIPFVHNGSKEWECVALHTPCMVKVILRSGAIEAWILFPVNKKHVVSFAPPTALVMLHGQVASHVMACSFHVQDGVIAFPFQISNIIDLR